MTTAYNFLHSDGSSWLTVHPEEITGDLFQREIKSVDASPKVFTVAGDLAYLFSPSFTFDIVSSNGNDGTYTVVSSAYTAGTPGETSISVLESIASDTAPFGSIQYVIPSTISLKLVGRGSLNFGFPLQTNILHLLENFAYTSAPSNPVKGQTWFDTSTNVLRVFDGSMWIDNHPQYARPAYETHSIVTGGVTVVNTTISTVAKITNRAYLQVFVNGVFQQEGISFTVTGPNQITFGSALSNPSNVVLFAFY